MPCDSERAACTFYLIQLQQLESPVISLSHSKQRALQGRELKVSCDSKRAAYAFYLIQLQQLEWSVASLLPARQKAPLRLKLHPPPILNELLTLFI
ncbi:hypothetical protein ABD97_18695 [Bacillus mycoides]|nr:hypothetical protein [Bacillus mycoides]